MVYGGFFPRRKGKGHSRHEEGEEGGQEGEVSGVGLLIGVATKTKRRGNNRAVLLE